MSSSYTDIAAKVAENSYSVSAPSADASPAAASGAAAALPQWKSSNYYRYGAHDLPSQVTKPADSKEHAYDPPELAPPVVRCRSHATVLPYGSLNRCHHHRCLSSPRTTPPLGLLAK